MAWAPPAVDVAGLERVDLLGDRRRPRRGVGGLAAEGVGQGDVHAAGHGAEAGGLAGEVAAGLAGVERPGGGASRLMIGIDDVSFSPNRSRSDVRASAQPSAAPARNGWRMARSKSPTRWVASGSATQVKPWRGQRLGDLDLGVVAPLDAPEQLEDEALVVDDRAVRLLGAHQPGPLRLLVRGHGVEDHQGQLGVVAPRRRRWRRPGGCRCRR